MYVNPASWINSQPEQRVFGHIYIISDRPLLIADIYTVTVCTLPHCLGCSCLNPSVRVTSVHLALFQAQAAPKWSRPRSSSVPPPIQAPFYRCSSSERTAQSLPCRVQVLPPYLYPQRDKQWGSASDGERRYGHRSDSCCPLQLPSASWRSHRDVHRSCIPVCVWTHFPLVGKPTAEPGIISAAAEYFLEPRRQTLLFSAPKVTGWSPAEDTGACVGYVRGLTRSRR